MVAKILVPSYEDLKRDYESLGSTLSSLAIKYKTSHPTIRNWLRGYGIALKSHRQASTEANRRNKASRRPSKESLLSAYSNSSIDEMERIFSVGQATIYEWLRDYKIELRDLSKSVVLGKERSWKNRVPNREDVIKKYKEHGNVTSLCQEFDLSPNSIRRLFREYEIDVEIPWRSKEEDSLYARLESIYSGWIKNDRTIIRPFELDMVHHDKKIAVEYCGLYWHSILSGGKTSDYHRMKYLKCNEAGYSLITVFKTDSTKFIDSLISAKCGISKRINARETRVVALNTSEAVAFEKQNHVHGSCGGSVKLGLVQNSDLLMTLTMRKSRFDRNYEWECARMTVKNGVTVIGGASKLMKHFVIDYKPSSIITYADLRFGTGAVYEKIGFKRMPDTPPNYWYFETKNGDKLYSRQNFQKHKLVDMPTYDSQLTEHEIMALSGYDRIYDCGNAKYVWMSSNK